MFSARNPQLKERQFFSHNVYHFHNFINLHGCDVIANAFKKNWIDWAAKRESNETWLRTFNKCIKIPSSKLSSICAYPGRFSLRVRRQIRFARTSADSVVLSHERFFPIVVNEIFQILFLSHDFSQ